MPHMHEGVAPLFGRHRLVPLAVLVAGLVLVGVVAAATLGGLTVPWLGGAGGESRADGVVLHTAVGQSVAGLSAGSANRLCVGAACPEGPVPGPPARVVAAIYLPLARHNE